MTDSVDPDETACNGISSGSTLFAKVRNWSAGKKELITGLITICEKQN